MQGWNVRDDRTFSSYFVTPMLEKHYSWLRKAGVINVFIGDERYPEYDNHILLLVIPSTTQLFNMLSDTRDFSTFKTRYTADNLYEMFVYEVPSKYKTQYDLLVNSDYTYYSKLGSDYMELVLTCHECGLDSDMYKIMTKHEDVYVQWEEGINKGLPPSNHIRIPRELEATKRFDMDIEIYRQSMML